MTTPTDAESASEDASFTKPNCTIKQRHDKQLDELAQARYASRSEALRAAIESLSRSVLETGETTTEKLFEQITSLSVRVDELAEQLDEMHEVVQGTGSAVRPSQSEETLNSEDVTSAVSADDSQATAALDEEVYALLAEQGPMSIPEIADSVPGSEMEIHESISRLVDLGFVTCAVNSEPRQYRIAEVTN